MEANQEKRRPLGLSSAAAIIIAAIIIGGGMHEVSKGMDEIAAGLNNQTQAQRQIAISLAMTNSFPDIMDLDQAAAYLNITSEQLKYVVAPESGLGMPVLAVDGQYRFSRTALDEWMKTPHRY